MHRVSPLVPGRRRTEIARGLSENVRTFYRKQPWDQLANLMSLKGNGLHEIFFGMNAAGEFGPIVGLVVS